MCNMYKNVLYVFRHTFYKSGNYLLQIFNTPFVNNFMPTP